MKRTGLQATEKQLNISSALAHLLNVITENKNYNKITLAIFHYFYFIFHFGTILQLSFTIFTIGFSIQLIKRYVLTIPLFIIYAATNSVTLKRDESVILLLKV